MRERFPEAVITAIGNLAIYALSAAENPDNGYLLECLDISVDPKPNDVPLGGWRIEIKRIAKP